MKSILLLAFFCAININNTLGQIVTTLAGSGSQGTVNGTGAAASFYAPTNICCDVSGNIYVADYGNHKIRKVTPLGIVTTFAGTGTAGAADNVIGTLASFNFPAGICTDKFGNFYVIEHFGCKVRKITASGAVSTLAGSGFQGSADGIGINASFVYPFGICSDSIGNLYIADNGNAKIRKVTQTGLVTTFAGTGVAGSTDGPASVATFANPCGICSDASGNIYVTELTNNKVRKISSLGIVTTLAGSGNIGSTDGVGVAASFNNPYGICADGAGNLYVADRGNNKIRKITSSGVVTTFAGNGFQGASDGSVTAASFSLPQGIYYDLSGYFYIADRGNNKIRRTGNCIDPPPPVDTTPLSNKKICQGNSSVLMSTGLSLINWYAQSSGGTSLTTGISYTVPNSLSAGVYTFFTETATSCTVSTNRTAVTLTVINLPSLTLNSGSVCAGQSFTITPSGTDIYYFTSGGPVVTPLVTTSFIVTGTNTLTSCSNTAITTVSVDTGPSMTAISFYTAICIGEVAYFGVAGANSYTWSDGQTGANIVVTPTTTTNYTVVGQNLQGCKSTSTLTQIVNVCNGIDEMTSQLLQDVEIIPNPNNGQFTIKTISHSEIKIFELTGRCIYYSTIDSGDNYFNLGRIIDGVYVISFSDGPNHCFKKIIINH